MKKFVIPLMDDTRPILFVSHQWTSFKHPDPSNVQFNRLQSALRSLLSGKVVQCNEAFKGHPGQPTNEIFASLLKDGLIWFDYISVPQLKARHNKFDSEDSDQFNPVPKSGNQLEQMLKAINSVPAYVRRAAIMMVLAPVVQHAENDTDCEFGTWFERGWCRLEACVGALVSSTNYMILVESGEKVSLINLKAKVLRDSVGSGQFACCAQNHEIEVDGVMQKIPCDREKIAPVLADLLDKRLMELKAQDDLSEYRMMRAHEHVIIRDLPNMQLRAKLDTWQAFAKEFKLDVGKPLKKSGGIYNWPPLIWAVMAMNVPVVKFLIEQKANVMERIPANKKAHTHYTDLAPMHLVMQCGSGKDSIAIVDMLLDAGADPYQYAKMKPYPFYDPLSAGILTLREDLVLHYMKKVEPRFMNFSDHFGGRNECFCVTRSSYTITKAFIEAGVEFISKNKFAMGALQLFCVSPKQVQTATDVRVLDLLLEHNKIGDLDAPMFNFDKGFSSGKATYHLLYGLCRMGLCKSNQVFQLVYKNAGGTALHMAVYRDKPTVVAWLLQNKADPERRTKLGQTALMMASQMKHQRCLAVLRGDAAAVRRVE
eukprot:gene299-47_t